MAEYTKKFYEFVETHLKDDVSRLLLSASRYKDIDVREAALQIQCRRKSINKLKPFLDNNEFLFPDLISEEQASDWRIAKYHASIIGIGYRILDMTAGLGIDSMTLAKHGNKLTAVDLDSHKANILCHNIKTLGINNIQVIAGDSIEVFKQGMEDWNIVFIDPGRRDQLKRRAYALSDCQPNIVALHREILNKGIEIWIKASPMLDVTAIRKELIGISDITCLGVEGECKEVLIHLVPDGISKENVYNAVDLDKKGLIKSKFTMSWISSLHPVIWEDNQLPDSGYIYRPNASLMKLPASGYLTSLYQELWKIGSNTELYYSLNYHPKFPGDCYKIIRTIDKKDFKNIEGLEGIVISRNYPEEATAIRKRLKVKEGDENVLIGCRVGPNAKPTLFLTEKYK